MSERAPQPSAAPRLVTGRTTAGPTRVQPRDLAVLCAVTVVVAALVAIVLGWLWMQAADPPRTFDDQWDFEREAGVTIWYWIVGAPVCLVAGLGFGLRAERLGVWSLVPVMVGCLVAAAVCAYTGHAWFAPDRAEEAQVYVQYQLVTARPGVESPLSVLVWLLAGLVGHISAVFTWDRSAR